jgi:hypothetical protein
MLIEIQNWIKEMKDKINNLFLEKFRVFPPYIEPCLFDIISFKSTDYFSKQDCQKILPCDDKGRVNTPKFSDWVLTQMLGEFRDIYLKTMDYHFAIRKFDKLHQGYGEELIYEIINQYKHTREKHNPQYIALHMPDIFPFKELEDAEFPRLEEAVFLYSKLLRSYSGVNYDDRTSLEIPKGRMHNNLAKVAEYTGIDASKIQSIANNLENNLEVQKYKHEQFGYKANEVSEHDLVNIYLEKKSGATYEEIIQRYHLSSMYSAKKTYAMGKEAYTKRTLILANGLWE